MPKYKLSDIIEEQSSLVKEIISYLKNVSSYPLPEEVYNNIEKYIDYDSYFSPATVSPEGKNVLLNRFKTDLDALEKLWNLSDLCIDVFGVRIYPEDCYAEEVKRGFKIDTLSDQVFLLLAEIPQLPNHILVLNENTGKILTFHSCDFVVATPKILSTYFFSRR